MRKYVLPIVIVAMAALAAAACSKTEGSMLDVAALGYGECDSNADCQPFGYCNESGYCDAECRDTADCYLYGERAGETLVCLNYQCVPEGTTDGDEDAEEEVIVTDYPCTYYTPEQCAEAYWIETDGNRDCWDYGWRYACSEESEMCIDTGDVDFGEAEQADDGWYDVWGSLIVIAARTQGIPLVPFQDTVSLHYLLTRMSLADGKLVIESDMCYMEMRNFKDEDVYPVGTDLGQLIIPPNYYNNVATLRHVVDDPPAFAAGAELKSGKFTELRGAKMETLDPEDLPDRAEYEATCGEWDPKGGERWEPIEGCRITDQDRDGKPGMTNIGIGALNNKEAYSDQLWDCTLDGEVIDNDHIMGLLPNFNVQNQIGGNDPAMVYDIEVITHPDADRSYFKFQRLGPDATCADVIKEIECEGGSWLSYVVHIGQTPAPEEANTCL
ncbi:MAG: hypothetical protein C4523_00180 [Myxococcales bacterium]|nr:MAG: hypothetical protein C4523_00180 [Myxococcales bacterium]